MPSTQHTRSSGGRSRWATTRPTYDEYDDSIGEDPARFLAMDPEDSSRDVHRLAIARIRGIDSEAVLDAWYDVEIDLGPRRPVLAALEARRAELTSSSEDDNV